jgi:ribosome maturation factor RimP
LCHDTKKREALRVSATMYAETLLPRLRDIARRAADPLGIDVAWVELKRQGSSWLFRVFIDHESGVGLEECEQVNVRLGVLLDVEDPIDSSYTLEVSTPGLDRPLWSKSDYQRFTGRLARIKTRERFEGKSRFHGRLAGVEGDAVVLEQEGQRWSIPFPVIESGRLEVEVFSPGRGQTPRNRS